MSGIQTWGPQANVYTFNVKVFGNKQSNKGPFVFGSSAQAKVRYKGSSCEILSLNIITARPQ